MTKLTLHLSTLLLLSCTPLLAMQGAGSARAKASEAAESTDEIRMLIEAMLRGNAELVALMTGNYLTPTHRIEPTPATPRITAPTCAVSGGSDLRAIRELTCALQSPDLGVKVPALRSVLVLDLPAQKPAILDELRKGLKRDDQNALNTLLTPLQREYRESFLCSEAVPEVVRTRINHTKAAFIQERCNFYLTDALGDDSDER